MSAFRFTPRSLPAVLQTRRPAPPMPATPGTSASGTSASGTSAPFRGMQLSLS